jgi:hypothetical protein
LPAWASCTRPRCRTRLTRTPSRSLLDGRSGAPLCAVYPLDKAANADGVRRTLQPTGPPYLSPLVPTTMTPLLRQLLAEHAATGLPPAFLPTPPRATAGVEPTTSSKTSS